MILILLPNTIFVEYVEFEVPGLKLKTAQTNQKKWKQ